MASRPCSPTHAVLVVSLTSKGNPVIASAAVSNSLALAMELFPQAVAGTSSAHTVAASSTQLASVPTRVVTSISTHSDRKLSQEDVHSSPTKRFRSGGKFLRTRLDNSSNSDSAGSPVDGAARSERETSKVAAFPPASSTGSAL